MLYELTGTNDHWMMIHAESPGEAIVRFEAHSPESVFLSIQEVRSTFEAISISGERVTVIGVRAINHQLHYETMSDIKSWVPATDFVRAEVIAA
jgi:hypothetical protein